LGSQFKIIIRSSDQFIHPAHLLEFDLIILFSVDLPVPFYQKNFNVAITVL